MQYLCLIYSAPDAGPQDEAGFQANMQRYVAFSDVVGSAGKLVGGEPLEGIDTATTVRICNGETIVTDGPFAETKEHLGGYCLLDCDNLDEALHYAAPRRRFAESVQGATGNCATLGP
ncbi:MAG: YciI family protein [Acidimicrobiales bacterium]